MALQHVFLDIVPGRALDFEAVFDEAVRILKTAEGYSRRAPEHLRWKALLDPYDSVRPQSTHFDTIRGD